MHWLICDQEQDPDRWCSHTAMGQEAWQIVSQWIWNLRLELGHQLHPDPVRTTEFAQAFPPVPAHTAPPSGYASPQVGLPWKTGRFSGQDFVLQPDGTLRCPASQSLVTHERRREADGSLRVVYAASIRSCRPCPLREQCQWNGSATAKPRQVSVLLHPLVVGSKPLRLRGTGVVGSTDGRASSCCAINASPSRSNLAPRLSPPSRLRPFPVRSGRTIGFRGQSGWLAMRAPKLLDR